MPNPSWSPADGVPVILSPAAASSAGDTPSDCAALDLVHHALACDRFVLHAQPIVHLRTGLTAREELLLRIVADDGRLVPACEFVPVAEKRGLMPWIDRLVIEQAAALASDGRAVHVNLSATT